MTFGTITDGNEDDAFAHSKLIIMWGWNPAFFPGLMMMGLEWLAVYLLLGGSGPARWLESAPLGGNLRVVGFVAAKGRNAKMPVIHANTIEYLEGNENGTILQEEG